MPRARMGLRRINRIVLLQGFLLCALVIRSQAAAQRDIDQREPLEPPASLPPSWGTRLAWYVPNRLLDLADIFRLRLKFGWGLSGSARATDNAAFFAGKHSVAYIGLPGARSTGGLRSPLGYENQHGLVVAGVDASDDVAHPPWYEFTECGLGLHVGPLGIEGGVTPTEIADFLTGIFFLDISKDDIPGRVVPRPYRNSVMSVRPEYINREIEPKPSRFPNTAARLEYIRRNVPISLRNQISNIDLAFADEQAVASEPPLPSELQYSLYLRHITGNDGSIDIKPKIKLKVDLPNLEHRIGLVFSSASNNELEGRDPVEREEDVLSAGITRREEKFKIDFDAGVRFRSDIDVYARASWRPSWMWFNWHWNFEQRLFWEAIEGAGVLTSLNWHRWLEEREWFVRNGISGRITETTEVYEWSYGLELTYAILLFEEAKRMNALNIGSRDTINGITSRLNAFGRSTEFSEFRILLGYRWALYDDFLVAELQAGPQWRREVDWEPELRIETGVSLVF